MKKALLYIFPLLSACTLFHHQNKTAINTIFDKQGHRGCRGLMPENTIPAMLTAIDLGVTTLELDVVISKDQHVVVSHDPWMNHEIITKPDGTSLNAKEAKKFVLYQMNYDEIKQFDAGLKPHAKFPEQKKIAVNKPLLSQLITDVEAHSKASNTEVNYNIETKSTLKGDHLYNPEPAVFVDLLITVLKEKNILERVTIQSFDFRTLQYLHSKYPGVKTSALIDAVDRSSLQEQLNQLGFTPDFYSPHYSLVTKTLIKNCHEKQIKVVPWTVNNLAKMQALKNAGVDGIISDYPNLFKGLK